MNSWFYVLPWMLMGAMVSMSYELSTPPVHTNPSSVATRPKRARKSDGTSERVKRFTRLSPSTQEKVLAYGENLLKYLEEEESKDVLSHS